MLNESARPLKIPITLFLKEICTAWQQRDLQYFMSLYDQSEDIFFTNAYGTFIGRDAIMRAYKPVFGKVGNLGLYLSEYKMLSHEHVLVTGSYARGQPMPNRTGYFTLVLHIDSGGTFKIVAIHES